MGIGLYLEERDITLKLAAKGKRSVLVRIAARLGDRTGLGERTVLAALLSRERLGSTGIGNGLAIPHALLDTIAAPALSLTTLETPVDYDAPDGAPVDLFLALMWPRADMADFLPMLARICRQLRMSDLRKRLRAATSPAEVIATLGAADIVQQPIRLTYAATPRLEAAAGPALPIRAGPVVGNVRRERA